MAGDEVKEVFKGHKPDKVVPWRPLRNFELYLERVGKSMEGFVHKSELIFLKII